MKLRTLLCSTALVFSASAHANQQLEKQHYDYSLCMQKLNVAQRLQKLGTTDLPLQEKVKQLCAQNKPAAAKKVFKELWVSLQKQPAYIDMNKCLSRAPLIKKQSDAMYQKMLEGDICQLQKD